MLTIVTYPESVLREKASPVERMDDELRALVDDMFDAMYADDGVGLAAPQIGVSKRLIVIDVKGKTAAMFNPVIVEYSKEHVTEEEGCLSVPGIRLDISRPAAVRVKGMGIDGEELDYQADGMLARAFQHEIDHLNGVLIIDHASSVQRIFFKNKLRKLEKLD
jgi:peptide deformylase